jgi:hypothetical protein
MDLEQAGRSAEGLYEGLSYDRYRQMFNLLRHEMGRGYHTIEHDDLDPPQRTRNHVMSVPAVFMWRSAEERLGIRSGFARTRSVRLTIVRCRFAEQAGWRRRK